MKKIGIIISRISQGARPIHNYNASEYESEVLDPRTYFKSLDLDLITEDELLDTFIDFLAFGKDVSFVCINRYISGRGGDMVSAMITIPGEILVTGKNLKDLIAEIKPLLLKSNPDYTRVNEIIDAVPFKSRVTKLHSSPSEINGTFAYRFYPSLNENYQLHEILGKDGGNIYQKYYKRFAAIFLIDNRSKIKPSVDIVNNDLSDKDITESAILKYPSNVRPEITLYINDDEFNEDYEGTKDEIVRVKIKRNGWNTSYPHEEVKLSKKINEMISLNSLTWKKTASRDWFYFINEEGNKDETTDIQIFINDEKVDGHTEFTENELQNAKISIQSEEFISNPKRVNVLNYRKEEKKIPIPITRKPKTLHYIIKERYGCDVPNKDIQFSIENSNHNPEKSPLISYRISKSYNGVSNEILLEPKGFDWKHYVIAGVICILAIYGVISIGEEITPSVLSFFNIGGDNKNGDDDTLNNAIDYLESKDLWVKTELEEISETSGLYDLLLEKNINLIDESYRSLEDGSSKLADVIKFISDNQDVIVKDFVYNNAINVRALLNWSAPVEYVEFNNDELNYLRTHQETWNREEMANISAKLGQLYDDVNKRDKNNIINKWDPALSQYSLTSWNSIRDAIYKSTIKPGTQYCEDGSITLDTYISKTSGGAMKYQQVSNIQRTTTPVNNSNNKPAPVISDGQENRLGGLTGD